MGNQKIFFHPLGSLESEVMEILWEREEGSVREVWKKLKKRRHAAYTTIMTVMSRLVEKGLLKRIMTRRGAYLYRPRSAKEVFFASASKYAIRQILDDFGEVAVAQFLDMMEMKDIKKAREWQRKLKKVL